MIRCLFALVTVDFLLDSCCACGSTSGSSGYYSSPSYGTSESFSYDPENQGVGAYEDSHSRARAKGVSQSKFQERKMRCQAANFREYTAQEMRSTASLYTFTDQADLSVEEGGRITCQFDVDKEYCSWYTAGPIRFSKARFETFFDMERFDCTSPRGFAFDDFFLLAGGEYSASDKNAVLEIQIPCQYKEAQLKFDFWTNSAQVELKVCVVMEQGMTSCQYMDSGENPLNVTIAQSVKQFKLRIEVFGVDETALALIDNIHYDGQICELVNEDTSPTLGPNAIRSINGDKLIKNQVDERGDSVNFKGTFPDVEQGSHHFGSIDSDSITDLDTELGDSNSLVPLSEDNSVTISSESSDVTRDLTNDVTGDTEPRGPEVIHPRFPVLPAPSRAPALSPSPIVSSLDAVESMTDRPSLFPTLSVIPSPSTVSPDSIQFPTLSSSRTTSDGLLPPARTFTSVDTLRTQLRDSKFGESNPKSTAILVGDDPPIVSLDTQQGEEEAVSSSISLNLCDAIECDFNEDHTCFYSLSGAGSSSPWMLSDMFLGNKLTGVHKDNTNDLGENLGFVYVGSDSNNLEEEIFVLESPKFSPTTTEVYIIFDLFLRSFGPQLRVCMDSFDYCPYSSPRVNKVDYWFRDQKVYLPPGMKKVYFIAGKLKRHNFIALDHIRIQREDGGEFCATNRKI